MPTARTAHNIFLAIVSLAATTLHGEPDTAPPAAHLAEIEKFAADIVDAMSGPGAVDDEHATAFTPNPDAFRLAVRPDGKPLVIAHRGASGYLPEHTLAAYAAAYFMGADVIEPDVVLTKDGVPICSHDITLDDTTDVAEKFPGRARDDGKHYAIDFTLAEIKTLEKLGREGRVRMHGHTVPTLSEMIEMVQGLNEQRLEMFPNFVGRNKGDDSDIGSPMHFRIVGIIPEFKDPAFHRAEGHDLSKAALDVLAEYGYRARTDRCAVQCFDLRELERIRGELKSKLSLVYLSAEPMDRETIKAVVKSCDAIGLRLISRQPDGRLGQSNPEGNLRTVRRTIGMAAYHGLGVYGWTFGTSSNVDENFDNLAMYGLPNPLVDGVFSDMPWIAAMVRSLEGVENERNRMTKDELNHYLVRFSEGYVPVVSN